MRNALLALVLASPLAIAAPPKLISAEDFGDAWPFVPEEMHLQCLPGNAVVVTDSETGRMYGVNGAATGRAHQLALAPLENVWANDNSTTELKISVAPIIKAGLQLCN